MPYIPEEERQWVDPLVDALADALYTEGQTNYAITRLLLHAWAGRPRYVQLNTIVGVLECVKLEFYRQFGEPYEDEKRKENGRVSVGGNFRFPERKIP